MYLRMERPLRSVMVTDTQRPSLPNQVEDTGAMATSKGKVALGVAT